MLQTLAKCLFFLHGLHVASLAGHDLRRSVLNGLPQKNGTVLTDLGLGWSDCCLPLDHGKIYYVMLNRRCEFLLGFVDWLFGSSFWNCSEIFALFFRSLTKTEGCLRGLPLP